MTDYKYPLNDAYLATDLRDLLRNSVRKFGDTAAFKIKDERVLGKKVKFDRRGLPKRASKYIDVSYAKYADDVNRLGQIMMTEFGKDIKVAIISETRYEWYVSYLATVNGLGVVIPLDNELPEEEVMNLLQRSEADVIIFSGNRAEMIANIREQVPSLKHFVAMDQKKTADSDYYFWDLLEVGVATSFVGSYINQEIDAQKMSVLLFTSGTTAGSKAVMLSHNNLCDNIYNMLRLVQVTNEDTLLSVLPLHHTYESTCGFLAALSVGATISVCDGLRYIVNNLQESKATVILVVPLMLQAFHKKIWKQAMASLVTKYSFLSMLKISDMMVKVGFDKRKVFFKKIHSTFGGYLRMIICGGAPVEAQYIKDFETLGFTCFQGYGLTECSPILALNRDQYSNPASAGLPMPGTEIKLINTDENGIGEVIAKSSSVMLGYYRDEAKTKEVIDEDGYFHTGDYGYFDENGFLILTGRKANIIVTANGKNIFPEELEFLLSEYDIVQEVVVTGKRNDKDEVELFAYIYPNMEFVEKVPELTKSKIDSLELRAAISDVIKQVNKRVSHYKHIKDFAIRTTEFEKTTTKKIKRRLVEQDKQ